MSSLRKLKRQQERAIKANPAASLDQAIKAIQQLKGLETSLQDLTRIEEFLEESKRDVGILISRQDLLEREVETRQEVMLRLLSRMRDDMPVEVLRSEAERIRQELDLDIQVVKLP